MVVKASTKHANRDVQLDGVALRQVEEFKYHGLWFASNGKKNQEMRSRISQLCIHQWSQVVDDEGKVQVPDG